MDTYNVRLSRYHLFCYSQLLFLLSQNCDCIFGISEVIIIIAFTKFSKSKECCTSSFYKFWILFSDNYTFLAI